MDTEPLVKALIQRSCCALEGQEETLNKKVEREQKVDSSRYHVSSSQPSHQPGGEGSHAHPQELHPFTQKLHPHPQERLLLLFVSERQSTGELGDHRGPEDRADACAKAREARGLYAEEEEMAPEGLAQAILRSR